MSGIVQLPLLDLSPHDMAVGAEEGSGTTRSRPHLHLVPKPTSGQEAQE